MGNRIKSLNLADMKAFTSALLAASAAAATTYTLAGNVATGVTSTTATAVVTLTGSSLTTRVTTTSVIAAAMAASDFSEQLGCFLWEADKTECSYCKFAYTSASNYTASWVSYSWTTTAPTIGATAAISSISTNFTIGGAVTDQASTAFGSAVASPVKTNGTTTQWAINEIKLGANAAAMASSCAATYTDSTTGTAARETVVKNGMATGFYHGQSYYDNSAGTKQSTGFSTKALVVSGALSNIATVGAAVAALAMSF